MAAHAKHRPIRVVDDIAAYWTLVVAFFVILLGLRPDKPGKHARPPEPPMPWPDGADLAWAEEVHAMQDTVVMRQEVRA